MHLLLASPLVFRETLNMHNHTYKVVNQMRALHVQQQSHAYIQVEVCSVDPIPQFVGIPLTENSIFKATHQHPQKLRQAFIKDQRSPTTLHPVVSLTDCFHQPYLCRNTSTSGLMLVLLELSSIPRVTTASTPDTPKNPSPM